MIEAVQNLEGNLGVGSVKEKYAPKHISFYRYNGTDLDYETKNLDTSKVTDMSNMFYECKKITELDLSNFDTSKVTNMSNMFGRSFLLKNIYLSNFDTSNVTDMSFMFDYCSLESLDLSNFDTSKVTNMQGMFNNFKGNLDLSNFDTSNVTNMSNMFSRLETEELDLSSLDTSKVTNMSAMFYDSENLKKLDLSNLDTSKVTNINFMFSGCIKLTELSEIDCSSVNNIINVLNYTWYLKDFGGFKDIGKAYSINNGANHSAYTISISTNGNTSSYTEQSLINVLNNLYDIATKGVKTQKVVLASKDLAKLTSEEGQQALENATTKGWTIG